MEKMTQQICRACDPNAGLTGTAPTCENCNHCCVQCRPKLGRVPDKAWQELASVLLIFFLCFVNPSYTALKNELASALANDVRIIFACDVALRADRHPSRAL